jgi:hypothetical protein
MWKYDKHKIEKKIQSQDSRRKNSYSLKGQEALCRALQVVRRQAQPRQDDFPGIREDFKERQKAD